MKINGVIVGGPNEEVLVLPRGDQMVPFVGRAISDFESFDAACPAPKVPVRLTPKGREENHDDPGYKQLVEQYNEKRMGWMVIETLKPSNIEWDKVDPEKPSTWRHWQDDFKAAGFTQIEAGHILRHVMEVNCLDEEKLKWARDVFLRGQQPTPES
jgi:hypothetical protein